MYTKILMLRFSKDTAQEAIVCNLAKEFDMTFNIMYANIDTTQVGHMVLEMWGTQKNFRDAVKYLKEKGITVQDAAQEIKRNDKKCFQCGACTAVCNSGALTVNPPTMEVVFTQNKCTLCERCIPACPTRAMEYKALR